MLEDVIKLKCFDSISEVFDKIGKPIFKCKNNKLYYIGNGFFVRFCTQKYYTDEFNIYEYGEEGEYVTDILFFQNKKELCNYQRLGNEEDISAMEKDILLDEEFRIIENIYIGDSYEKVLNSIAKIESMYDYPEREIYILNKEKDKLEFNHKFIRFGNYNFLFFGKSKNTKLTSFEFAL